jgi:hypothetical protein
VNTVVTVGTESKLRREISALREANEDLRLSAVRWKAMYESAVRRCVELEAQLKQSAPLPH